MLKLTTFWLFAKFLIIWQVSDKFPSFLQFDNFLKSSFWQIYNLSYSCTKLQNSSKEFMTFLRDTNGTNGKLLKQKSPTDIIYSFI